MNTIRICERARKAKNGKYYDFIVESKINDSISVWANKGMGAVIGSVEGVTSVLELSFYHVSVDKRYDTAIVALNIASKLSGK